MIDSRHYTLANFKQRMRAKEWKLILLNRQETITFRGDVVKLVAKSLGFGVVEISKDISDDS